MDIIGFVSEVVVALVKHGWSVSSLVIFIFALFKFTPFRRFVMRRLPKWLRRLDNRMDGMDIRISRMEAKIDAIARHMGVENWNAEEHALTANMGKSLSKSSQEVISPADSVGVSIRRMNNLLNWRMKTMKSKFTSRKFILAVVSAILIILNDGLELGIDSETVIAFAGLVATYIVGESAVDVARKPAGGTTNAQSYGDTEQSV